MQYLKCSTTKGTADQNHVRNKREKLRNEIIKFCNTHIHFYKCRACSMEFNGRKDIEKKKRKIYTEILMGRKLRELSSCK